MTQPTFLTHSIPTVTHRPHFSTLNARTYIPGRIRTATRKLFLVDLETLVVGSTVEMQAELAIVDALQANGLYEAT